MPEEEDMTGKVRAIAPHLRALGAPEPLSIGADGPWFRALREFLSYDPETGSVVWRKKPVSASGSPVNRVRVGQEAGWLDTSNGYRRLRIANKCVHAHRVAYFLATGWWAEEIDHINGDRADNRLSNLRPAFHAENMRNVKRRTDNRSGHPGVSRCNRDNKWYAYIAVDGKTHSLGRHINLEDAIAARQRAELAFHGAFAYHISRVEA